jgi:single-strand DNA-binding protein
VDLTILRSRIHERKDVIMTDNITLTGLVATTPRHLTTSEGLAITSFRLASSQRRFDRASN